MFRGKIWSTKLDASRLIGRKACIALPRDFSWGHIFCSSWTTAPRTARVFTRFFPHPWKFAFCVYNAALAFTFFVLPRIRSTFLYCDHSSVFIAAGKMANFIKIHRKNWKSFVFLLWVSTLFTHFSNTGLSVHPRECLKSDDLILIY